jgi:hypothetical protein
MTRPSVAQATGDPEWQAFRESLKGTTTKVKLAKLREYFEESVERSLDGHMVYDDVCVRVDNYLKALARGGQLERGINLETAILSNWKVPIRK